MTVKILTIIVYVLMIYCLEIVRKLTQKCRVPGQRRSVFAMLANTWPRLPKLELRYYISFPDGVVLILKYHPSRLTRLRFLPSSVGLLPSRLSNGAPTP